MKRDTHNAYNRETETGIQPVSLSHSVDHKQSRGELGAQPPMQWEWKKFSQPF